MSDRLALARASRLMAADALARQPFPEQVNNGEEGDYPFVANFSKGLAHDDVGEVVPSAYNALLRAVSTQRAEDFERIPVTQRKLVNPQSGLAFDLEGPDPQSLRIPPAPRIDGPRNSAEMVELYWMALLRDVPFIEFDNNPLAKQAAAELTKLPEYRGPRLNGVV